jgi:hypothetical protein
MKVPKKIMSFVILTSLTNNCLLINMFQAEEGMQALHHHLLLNTNQTKISYCFRRSSNYMEGTHLPPSWILIRHRSAQIVGLDLGLAVESFHREERVLEFIVNLPI